MITLLSKPSNYVLALVLSGTLSACSATGKPASTTKVSTDPNQITIASNTLYAALGGKPGVKALSEQFIMEIASDDRIRPRFAKTDIGRFHHMMQDHLCELTDGPCSYEGDTISRTHGGMNIRTSEFNAMVQALMRAMDKEQLPIATQNRLLARLAPFHSHVVGR